MPLACVADQCRSACITASECISGACVAGACDEPIAGIDAGAGPIDASADAPSDDAALMADVGSDAGADAGCIATSCAYGRCAGGGCDDAVALALGAEHLCIARAGGTVVCDGNDDAGQIGYGMSVTPWRPRNVLFVNDARQIVAGDSYACAVLGDHTVSSWGSLLGNGSGASSNEPVSLAAIGVITDLAAGASHACALHDGGTVGCWGSDNVGQCGDGGTGGGGRTSPVAAVPAITGALDIAAGSNHTCVVRSSGAVSCWGACAAGQCGNGSSPPVALGPVDVVGLTESVVEIAAGGDHTCGRYASGHLACWGRGTEGQLGYGGASDQPRARDVVGVSGATALCVGYRHTCALLQNGDVMCWGLGDHGAMGDGMTSTHLTPMPAMISGATHITCGMQATCAIRTDGSVWCWGWDQFGLMMMSEAMMPNLDVRTPARIPALE
jgi:alpha-tubulin suppressor-like RCC1 family protein